MSLLRMVMLLVLGLALVGCSHSSSPDASRNPAELHGKSQAWFAEHWGKPSARAKRFFGGETWVYSPKAGGTFPFLNNAPSDCRMSLVFDREGNLEASTSSGC